MATFFTLIFPIVMFLVFKLIKFGTNATDEIVPIFKNENLVASIAVFSFTFICLSLSLQISKDRISSFQSRLTVSPMRAVDFFIGYFLPSFVIALFQIFLTVTTGLCFGMNFSINIIYAVLSLTVISIFYISVGIIIGSCFSEKACGGVSSILVNITAIFSGMFFPLSNGTFKNVLCGLPFFPSVAIPQGIINGDYSNFHIYIAVFTLYLFATVAVSILQFIRKFKKK